MVTQKYTPAARRTFIYSLSSNVDKDRFEEFRKRRGLPAYFIDPKHGPNVVYTAWLIDIADLTDLEIAFLEGMGCAATTGVSLPWKESMSETELYRRLFVEAEKRQYCVWPSQRILFEVSDLTLLFFAACAEITSVPNCIADGFHARNGQGRGEIEVYMAWINDTIVAARPRGISEAFMISEAALKAARVLQGQQWNLYESSPRKYTLEYQNSHVFTDKPEGELLASVREFIETQQALSE